MGYNKGKATEFDVLITSKIDQKGIDGKKPTVILSKDGQEWQTVDPEKLSQGHRGAGWWTLSLDKDDTNADRLAIQGILGENEDANIWRDIQRASEVHVMGIGKQTVDDIIASITQDIDRLENENDQLGDGWKDAAQRAINQEVIDALARTILNINTLVQAATNTQA